MFAPHLNRVNIKSLVDSVFHMEIVWTMRNEMTIKCNWWKIHSRRVFFVRCFSCAIFHHSTMDHVEKYFFCFVYKLPNAFPGVAHSEDMLATCTDWLSSADCELDVAFSSTNIEPAPLICMKNLFMQRKITARTTTTTTNNNNNNRDNNNK